uniref:Uncharacterized protein n=2 Tax=Helicobacter pylori TaxID=210 RepID=Q9ZIK5_HELPX|nr:hypothetical protein [Helicobacter pylori]
MFALIQRKRQIRENLKNRSTRKDAKNFEKLSNTAEEIISKKQEELQSKETPEGKHDGERLSSVTEEIISKKLEELKTRKDKGD